jgi:hypothetical protein
VTTSPRHSGLGVHASLKPQGRAPRRGSISAAVRPEMGLVGGLSNQTVQDRLRRLADRVEQARSSASGDHAAHRRRALRRRCGSIPAVITAILASSDGDLRVRDIHAAVEEALGGSVAASSIRDCLVRCARGNDPLVERVARGRYRLR